AAKPRTAIMRNIIVSVGICARNSIISPFLNDLRRSVQLARTRTPPKVRYGGGVSGTLMSGRREGKLRGLRFRKLTGAPKVPDGKSGRTLTKGCAFLDNDLHFLDSHLLICALG